MTDWILPFFCGLGAAVISAWGVGVMVYGCLLAAASLNGRKGCFRAWVYGAAVSFTALCFY